MNLDYRLFIPSKGRAAVCVETVRHYISKGVEQSRIVVCVEPQDYKWYRTWLDCERLAFVQLRKIPRNDKGVIYARQQTLEICRNLNPKYAIFANDNLRIKSGNLLWLVEVLKQKRDAILSAGYSAQIDFLLYHVPKKKITMVEPRLIAVPRSTYWMVDFRKRAWLCEDTLFILDTLLKNKGKIYTKANLVFSVKRFKAGGNKLHSKRSGKTYKWMVHDACKMFNSVREYKKLGLEMFPRKNKQDEWDIRIPKYGKQRRGRVVCL